MYNGGFGAYPQDDMGVNSYFGESDTNFFGDTSNDSFFGEGAGFTGFGNGDFFNESVDMGSFGSSFFSESSDDDFEKDFDQPENLPPRKATPNSGTGSGIKKIGSGGSTIKKLDSGKSGITATSANTKPKTHNTEMPSIRKKNATPNT